MKKKPIQVVEACPFCGNNKTTGDGIRVLYLHHKQGCYLKSAVINGENLIEKWNTRVK